MYYKGASLTKHEGRFALAIGGKYMVDHFSMGIGGGAANVAIGVQKHGLQTAILGKIGNNQFKSLIHHHLKEAGVPTTLCIEEEDYLKISSILLADGGERTIIHYETPHEHVITNERDLMKLENARMVYLSNLWRVSLDERRKILAHVQSKGVMTMVNLGIADCRRPIEQILSLLHHTSILIVNAYEFAEMIKRPVESLDLKEDMTNFFPLLKTKVLIITDGKRGAYTYIDDGIFYEPAQKVSKIVDTTGAGDGFSAGFIAGYLEKNNIQYAMHMGSKRAAQIIGKIGAN